MRMGSLTDIRRLRDFVPRLSARFFFGMEARRSMVGAGQDRQDQNTGLKFLTELRVRAATRGFVMRMQERWSVRGGHSFTCGKNGQVLRSFREKNNV